MGTKKTTRLKISQSTNLKIRWSLGNVSLFHGSFLKSLKHFSLKFEFIK
jgi:hypothetical protein